MSVAIEWHISPLFFGVKISANNTKKQPLQAMPKHRM